MVKNKNVNMDLFYFKKYSKYVKDGHSGKSALNLFLTLKKCRKGCYIHIHSRYLKSFERILKYYKMNYEERKDDDIKIISFIISKNKISEKVKNAFLSIEHQSLGEFLDYPIIMDLDKIDDMKNIGSISFVFETYTKNNKKYQEYIYGFRAPNKDVTTQFMSKMNIRAKKYKKCIQKYLNSIYTNFNLKLVHTY